MSATFEKHPRVDQEIADIADYIGARNVTAGISFIDAVERAFQRIRDFPMIANTFEWEDEPRLKNVRLWPVPGFENDLIMYQVIRDRVTVLHLAHGARDLFRLLQRDR